MPTGGAEELSLRKEAWQVCLGCRVVIMNFWHFYVFPLFVLCVLWFGQTGTLFIIHS